MTDQVRDDQLDRKIHDFLAWHARDTSGAPSAIDVANRIAARSAGGVAGPWPMSNLAWIILTGLLLAALVGAAIVGANLIRRPMVGHSNGAIAVSANPPGRAGELGDIYLLSEGSSARLIVGSDGDGVAQACPRFAPDGQALAYGQATASDVVTAFRGRWPVADRSVALVRLNAQGEPSGQTTQVRAGATSGPIPCPEWSPDGRFVAFRLGSELWITDAASGETHSLPITAQPGWEQNDLEWSRDGSLIAVSEPDQIRLVRLDGHTAGLIPVAGDPGAAPRSIGWTAADTRIVYIATDLVGDGLAVMVIDADGTNAVQLSSGAADLQPRFYDAVVSPAGDRVAFAQTASRCSSDTNGDESCVGIAQPIFVMDLDGSNVLEIPIDLGFGGSGLQWSPDGQRLLFGSLAGVTSTGLTTGSAVIVYSGDELDLEWSRSELTWQPVP